MDVPLTSLLVDQIEFSNVIVLGKAAMAALAEGNDDDLGGTELVDAHL